MTTFEKPPIEHACTTALIGGGQMASALIAGMLRSGWRADRIIVLEPNAEQRDRLAHAFGVRLISEAQAELAEAEVVLWAVKPQQLREAAGPVVRFLQAPLHVSIVAGIRTEALGSVLQTQRVVRAMPNTPALVGAGVTGLLAMQGATPADRELVQAIMRTAGHVFWVDSDADIDAVTAASGSGPGYVFLFLECYQHAVQALGFSVEQARELVLRTAAGAIAQADSDGQTFASLREKVTSKGGTTAAGLDVLNDFRLSEALNQALRSACLRAQALSQEFGAATAADEVRAR